MGEMHCLYAVLGDSETQAPRRCGARLLGLGRPTSRRAAVYAWCMSGDPNCKNPTWTRSTVEFRLGT